MTDHDPINNWTACDLASNIRSGKITSEEVILHSQQVIAASNPEINAVVYSIESALADARQADKMVRTGQQTGPLHGVPVSIKDSFDFRACPTTSGTVGRANTVASRDAVVVQRLRRAGAIIIAKTNTPEFCLAYETDNNLFGRTNNPYNPALTSGGSSGGEAALIAVGGSPLGIGSDSGGSIRIPAHFCGVAGFKPSDGRLSLEGHIPEYQDMWQHFAQPGPLARSVADIWLAFKVLCGQPDIDPQDFKRLLEETTLDQLRNLKIVFFSDNGVLPASSETRQTILEIMKELSRLGLRIEEKCPAVLSRSYDLFLKVNQADGAVGIIDMLTQMGTSLSDCHPFTRRLIDNARLSPYNGYPPDKLDADVKAFRREMRAFMQYVDIIVSPVFPTPAFRHKQSFDEDIHPGFSYVSAYNLAGFPAAVVPVGLSTSGLPIGIQIAAAPANDKLVLKIAAWVEYIAGFRQTVKTPNLPHD